MIRIEELIKDYKGLDKNNKAVIKRAVDKLSLHIEKGEIFGLLGPNGAGKTTTIRMLTMLTRPSSGEVYYNGLRMKDHQQEIKKLIGVVPQHINFDQDLTVGENMELNARLHHMNKEDRQARIKELLEYVELSDTINNGVRSLSGGMKRRLLIARALIHRPRILFMDEPTVALDPQVRRRIWALIKELAGQGVTVLLTTHYIEEAEELCQRVAMLNKGKLVEVDTPKNFCTKYDKHNLEEVFIQLTGNKIGK